MIRNLKIPQLAFSLILLFCSSTSFAQTYGKNGMVVSDNFLASEVGIEILKKGGNAIDAVLRQLLLWQ
jgi:gamma-glutamyltranspeptidase/glutathione hydrolase